MVPVISQLVPDEHADWVIWARNLAYLGFVVTVIKYLQQTYPLLGEAGAYVKVGETMSSENPGGRRYLSVRR